MEIYTLLNDNVQILGIIISILVVTAPAIWNFIVFLSLKNKEIAHNRFKIYHELIENLVQSDKPKLDRQIAIIFELRNFKEYFELTTRILEGLRNTWDKPENSRIINEIDITITYIENNVKWKSIKFNRKNIRQINTKQSE
jgi:hypothetical protein